VKQAGVYAIWAVALWIAVALQSSVMPYVPGNPDLVLVLVSVFSLTSNRAQGAGFGFAAGVWFGAVAGANVAHYTISRVTAGFLGGMLPSIGVQAGYLIAAATTAGLTIVAQFLLLFLAPPPSIAGFLLSTIVTAMVNGVLALPVYGLLRRFANPPSN